MCVYPPCVKCVCVFGCIQLGNLKAAVTDFTAALAIDPSNANAYCNRGSSLEKVRVCVHAHNLCVLAWLPCVTNVMCVCVVCVCV